MSVLKIVANLASADVEGLAAFYTELFELNILMDHGWITMLGNDALAPLQLNVASHGGSNTPVPDLSITVDDVDACHARAVALGHKILYPLTDEPWGVRRFYVADPMGRALNVLAHI